ncbi:MAG: RNA polymerase sporulation sigma factor SigG [Oscillospiraceae bacterium]|jgi:RNA polymerase sporulation-specific sigma factor|nr:RNA polymerase sporulation sigma factor SigG [Oscillospiraceae bacterium]
MGYNGKVEISGINTSHLTVLKREEAKELFLKAKEGDEDARQKLIQGNLRLVLSVIKKFENRNENIDDLFQVGCIGLIKGIDNFDVSLNVLPSTYLVPMIIGEIRRYLRDNSTIRVSRSMRDTAYKVLQAKERLMGKNQKEPTIDELAKDLGLPREDVIVALDAILDPVSLYEPVYSDGGDALYVMDQVRDRKNTDEHWLEQIALKEAISHLGERERHILSLRFYEGKTQMEVSAEVGISQAQVSRLEKSALASIKKKM